MNAKSLPIYVSLADVHAMLRVCKTDRDRLLLDLLWRTGGRISEVLAIRVGDITDSGIRMINLKQGHWQKQADGTRRHIAIPTEKQPFVTKEFISEIRERTRGLPLDAYVITRLNGPEPITRQRAYQIVTQAAGVAGVWKRKFADGTMVAPSPHKLRHGHAVHLIVNGMPVTLAQAQLGHSSLQSTQIYAALADPHRARLIASVQF